MYNESVMSGKDHFPENSEPCVCVGVTVYGIDLLFGNEHSVASFFSL